MTRALGILLLALSALAQQPAAPVEPPEEDASLKPAKEYALNPVQAEKEYKIGLFYAKKGSWRAAANRFEEATKWDPGYADAYFKRTEALEKLGDTAKLREALEQFLEAAPDDKRAAAAQKKLKALPPPPPEVPLSK